MGRVARPKPAKLTEKLLSIRTALDKSQNGMLRLLGLDEQLFRSAISGYELGTREPPLPILLKYARIAGVCLEVLVDDELTLPAKLPVTPSHEAQRPTSHPKSKGSR